MSIVQQHMFAYYLLSPNDFKYNLILKYTLSEEQTLLFNRDKFRKAIRRLLLDHALLRSTFHQNGLQFVYREHVDDIESKLDLLISSTNDSNNNEHSSICVNLTRKPFRLEFDFPFRVHFVNCFDSKSLIILIVTHHIAVDGYSLTKLIHTQLWQLYDDSDLSNPIIPFHQYLQDKSTMTINHIQWWQSYLNSIKHIPLYYSNHDHLFEFEQQPDPQCSTLEIPEDLWNHMENLCKSSKTTIFTLCLSSIWLLLSRYTQNEKHIINIAVSSRPTLYHHTVGPFAHQLPIYLAQNESTINNQIETFIQFLVRTRRLILEIKQHEVVDLSDIPCDFTNIQSTVKQDISIGISDITSPNVVKHIQSCECIFFNISALTIYLLKNQRILNWCFNENIIKRSTIHQLQTSLLTLLREITQNAQYPVDVYNLISPNQFKQISTTQNYDQLTLHGIFERAVELWPHRIAIQYQDHCVTYFELNKYATKLAIHFQRQGIKANDFICILFDRSIQTIIALLAILKSGAACIPIDINLSTLEIYHILNHSESKLLLISPAAIHLWHNQLSNKQIPLSIVFLTTDSQNDLWTTEDIGNYRPIYNSKNLAYALWTSGTIGSAKWVEINHGSLANSIMSIQNESPLTPDDKMLQISSFCFNRSISELFRPLSQGACVILLNNNLRSDDVHSIIQLIKQYQVTTLEITPSLLHRFNPDLIVPPIRVVYVTGENCPLHIAQLWSQRVTLYNIYGSTEISLYTHIMHLAPNQEHVLIGRSLPNIFSYILNHQMQPVTIGMTGTLWIGGCAPARAYRNNTQLTNKKFIKNPFCNDYENIIYNTNDLVRCQSNGLIEYLGRANAIHENDNYYIELSTIENCLLNFKDNHHPQNSPREVVVIFQNYTDNTNNDKLICLNAYVTPKSVNLIALKQHVQISLPYKMWPTQYITLDQLPLSKNDKVDWNVLMKYTIKYNIDEQLTKNRIHKIWCLLLTKESIGFDQPFFEISNDNAIFLKIVQTLKVEFFADRAFNLKCFIEKFSSVTTINKQAFLVKEILYNNNVEHKPKSSKKEIKSRLRRIRKSRSIVVYLSNNKQLRNHSQMMINKDCAVIGMAGLFPGCNNIDDFWSMLVDGRSGIVTLSDEELHDYVPIQILTNNSYVRRTGRLMCGIDVFDHEFFGITPMEAKLMDPQHRLLLETVYRACEDAAINLNSSHETIGCYIAANDSSYYAFNLKHLWESSATEPTLKRQIQLNNMIGTMATRVANCFNLKGPAINIQTACSSGLVALHLAIDSLREGRCTTAIVGTSCIHLPTSGYLYEQSGIYSPIGRCAPFDASANGIVLGDAVCAIVLKLSEQAIKKRHHIRALIKSCAVNNNGSSNYGTSFTTPNAIAQAVCIREALLEAKVKATDIAYVEAHGTGTVVGDPIEIEGLTKAFNTDKRQYCTIGSVKSNVGHTDAAAGLVGLIKTVLVLQHRYMPATLHFQSPNPNIDFELTPFIVQGTGTRFKTTRLKQGPLFAGVTSLGIGGTNAHAVLQEYRCKDKHIVSSNLLTNAIHQVTISGKDYDSLVANWEQFITWLTKKNYNDKLITVANICYTLNNGRTNFRYRLAATVEASSLLTLTDALSKVSINEYKLSQHIDRIVFLFPGQHKCSRSLTRQLYLTCYLFRQAYDECANILRDHTLNGLDMTDILFSDINEGIDVTWNTWMALVTFIIEYSLMQMWLHVIRSPCTFVGHSLGEYVVAVKTGVLTLDEALKLVFARTLIINQQSTSKEVGSMLAVQIAYDQAMKYISVGRLSIAAVNGPRQCVLAGDIDTINQLKTVLSTQKYRFKQLEHTFPFHSHMVTSSLLDQFREVYRDLKISARSPKIPFVSTVTGEWCNKKTIIDVDHWCRHLRQTVLWESGIQMLDRSNTSLLHQKEHATIYVECALSSVLTNVTAAIVKKNSSYVISTVIQDTIDIELSIKKAIGACWCYGLDDIKYQHVYDLFESSSNIYGTASFITLPGYVFNRYHHWIDSSPLPVISNNTTNQNLSPTIESKRNNRKESTILMELIEIYKHVIGTEFIDQHSNFFTHGGNSHTALIIIGRINTKFNIQMAAKDILELPVAKDLAARMEIMLNNHISNVSTSNIDTTQHFYELHFVYTDERIILMKEGTSSSQTPIFVIAPCGGTCFIYRDLCKYLDDSITVIGLKYPEISSISLCDSSYTVIEDSVENLAAYYIRVMHSVLPDAKNFTLLGTSFGGMVAYEISQQLTSQSSSTSYVNQLFMVDTPMKDSLRVPFDTTEDITNKNIQAFILWAMFGTKYNFSFDEAECNDTHNDEQMKQFCIKKKILLNDNEDNNIEFEQLKQYMRIFKRNIQAILKYIPQPSRSQMTYINFIQVMSPLPYDPFEPYKDWSQLVSQEQFSLFHVKGHHLSVNFDPDVQALANIVNETFLSKRTLN